MQEPQEAERPDLGPHYEAGSPDSVSYVRHIIISKCTDT